MRTHKAASNSPLTDAEKVSAIDLSLTHLRQARERLRAAGAKNAADYVARAIKSTEGAKRHARRRELDGEYADRESDDAVNEYLETGKLPRPRRARRQAA